MNDMHAACSTRTKTYIHINDTRVYIYTYIHINDKHIYI